MGTLFIFFPFQFLDFQVESLAPNPLSVRKAMGSSATNPILKFQGDASLRSFVDQVWFKFSDDFRGVFRGRFPNMLLSMSVLSSLFFFKSKTPPKKSMKDFQRTWVNLRNGYFKIIAIVLPSMLDRDTTLAIKESSRPHYPMISRHRGEEFRHSRNQLTARLIGQEVSASISSPSKIMHGTHSVAVTWTAAIIDGAKGFLSSHDIIISSHKGLVYGC